MSILKKMLLLSSLFAFSACGLEAKEAETVPGEKLVEKVNEKEESVVTRRPVANKEKEEENELEEPAETTGIPPLSENNYQSLYEALEGKTFIFSSGAGAWGTSFTFEEEGKFSGKYYDADNMERVESHFEGQFVIRDEMDAHTYRLTLDTFRITSETGKEEMDGQVHVTYIDSVHGFPKGSKRFELYLPYKDKSELSEMYLSWVYSQRSNELDYIETFGLYNVDHEFGMEESSY